MFNDHILFNRELHFTNLSTERQFTINVKKFNTFFENKEYSTIIAKPKSFLAAIVKATFSVDKNDRNFKINQSGDDFKVWTNGCSLSKDFNRNVETIRNFFLEASTKKEEFKLFVLDTSSYCFINNSLDDLYNEKNSNFAAGHLFPGFPKLATFCGAYCEESEEQHDIANYKNKVKSRNVKIFRISWQKIFKFKEFIESNLTIEFFYQDYLNKLGCDFTITDNTNTVIKVHSTILRHHASLPFRNMLDLNVKENIDQTIQIIDFSSNTICAYLDYLYLGGKKFFEKMTSETNSEINLIEFFEFANKYLDDGFIDCCTNLFGYFCNKEHIEMIEELNSKYNNKHLNELLESLIENK